MRATEFVTEDDSPVRLKLGSNASAAQAWINRVYAKYPLTMQNNHVMTWGSGDDQQFAMFELTPSFSKRGAVEVKWFQAYPLRAGVGSRAMKELQAMAREDGISLTLFPWDKGQVSQSKLTKFYRGQGFKPTQKGSKSMFWDPGVNEQIVTELKINNVSGIGAVPFNQEIGYQGLQVVMRPSMFLELASPLDTKSADERKTIEYIKQNLDEKGIGAPWLTVVVPEAWELEDFNQTAHVRDHDGRHRMHSILEQEGNDPVEVHIIIPHMRRRHITDAMVDQLRSGLLNQQGQYVSGPVFGVAK
jgi:hypothetical protein